MEDLKGRVVLVTGGGRGLGEAVCQTLSSAGASVIVADIRQELAEKVAGEIQASGKEAIGTAARCHQRGTSRSLCPKGCCARPPRRGSTAQY